MGAWEYDDQDIKRFSMKRREFHAEPKKKRNVTDGFFLFEGRANFFLHFIEECSAESIKQIVIAEMAHMFPKAAVAKTAFG